MNELIFKQQEINFKNRMKSAQQQNACVLFSCKSSKQMLKIMHNNNYGQATNLDSL